jgi:hypothetical protein
MSRDRSVKSKATFVSMKVRERCKSEIVMPIIDFKDEHRQRISQPMRAPICNEGTKHGGSSPVLKEAEASPRAQKSAPLQLIGAAWLFNLA